MSSNGRVTSKALTGPISPTRISFDEKTIEEALRRAERDSDRRRSWRNREVMLEERNKYRSTIEEEPENEKDNDDDDETRNEIDVTRVRANAMAALEGRSTPPQRSHRRHRSYQGDRSFFTAQDEQYSEYARPKTATAERHRPHTAVDTSLSRPEFTSSKRTHSKTALDNSGSLPSPSRRRTNSNQRDSRIQFASTPPFFPPHPLHSNPVLMTPDSSSSEEEEPEMEEQVVMAWEGNTLIEKRVMSPKNAYRRRPSSMNHSMSPMSPMSPLSPLSPLTPITPFSPSPSARPRPRPKSAICTSTSRTTIMRDSSAREPSPPLPSLTKTSTTYTGRTRSNSKSQAPVERRLSRTNTGEEHRLSRSNTGEERRKSRSEEVEKLRASAKHVLLNAPKVPNKKTSLTSFRDPDVLEKELRRKSGIRGLGWLSWS